MNFVLEPALRAARDMPSPGAWLSAQVLAGIAAFAWVCVGTRNKPKLRLYFMVALIAGALGAAVLGTGYRILDRFSGRAVDIIGVSSYGALFAISLCFTALAKRDREPVLPSLDLIAPSLALLVGIGRLGCLFAGCDSGGVTASPLGVRFPAGTATFREHVARGLVLPTDQWSLGAHPAQLYEAVGALVLAAIGASLVRNPRLAPGKSFVVIAIGYAIVRGGADILRLPAPNALYGLSTSIVVAALAAATLCLRSHGSEYSSTSLS